MCANCMFMYVCMCERVCVCVCAYVCVCVCILHARQVQAYMRYSVLPILGMQALRKKNCLVVLFQYSFFARPRVHTAQQDHMVRDA